jgi:hypothetical protein
MVEVEFNKTDSVHWPAAAAGSDKEIAMNASRSASRRPRLRVCLIGGVDRSPALLSRAAASVNCEVEHHTGHMTGRGADGLAGAISRADLVVILTDVNSHNAVLAARRLAVARGVRYVLMRRCSPRNLVALIEELSTQTLDAAS